MIRRISTKLVLAVLTAVVLPFVLFAFYIDVQMGERLTRHVVEQALKGQAKKLAEDLDSFVVECHQDVAQWADTPLTVDGVEEYAHERGRRASADDATRWDAAMLTTWAKGDPLPEGVDPARITMRAAVTHEFDRYVTLKAEYDVLLLVAADGRLVTSTSLHPGRTLLTEEYVSSLFAVDYSTETWFREALDENRIARVDHHPSPYALLEGTEPADPAWGYHIGFAAPVHAGDGTNRPVGVLYALVNWYYFQQRLASAVLQETFAGLVDEEREPSPYAWIWAADADTILGHPSRDLYYESVSNDVGLPEMTRAVRESESGWGLYPEYTFKGEKKNAAFKRCRGPEDGGFGWVVGVGIDNKDIFATADELRSLLLGGTSTVLLMAILWTFYIARRTTSPILELQKHTRRVAEGDLDAQVTIRAGDELGALADDLNTMTRKLKEQQEHIVKVEKDAAWREMARQIAHDLKNPLTPIRLSLDLLERARRENRDGSDEILERTMELVRRQVEHLQEIARDFYEFTGGGRLKIELVRLDELVAEVLHLHDAWAVELGVEVHCAGDPVVVACDVSKLRRVFVNLVTNALHAMPEGGALYVDQRVEHGDGGDRVVVTFRDTGVGLAEDARAHLFEPYFTTKSEGTGLGLAISKQVVELMGGTIALEPAPDGEGTVAIVQLPLGPEPAPS